MKAENDNALKAMITDDKLIIELPVNKPPKPSSTGKTLVVASTHGTKRTTVEIDGKPLYIAANAFVFK